MFIDILLSTIVNVGKYVATFSGKMKCTRAQLFLLVALKGITLPT